MFYKHIHCCRYIWNYMLELQNAEYAKSGKYIQEYDMINLLPSLKNMEDKLWLYEVSHTSLQKICKDLHKAYIEFFEHRNRHPRFKTRRKSKLSYPVRNDKFYFTDDTVQIEKVGKVKYKTDINIPKGRHATTFYNPRIKYINGKWILAVAVEYESQVLDGSMGRVGIDLGIKKLATVSYLFNKYDGNDYESYPNINRSKYMQRLERKIIHYKRVMNRKRRVNNNYRIDYDDGSYTRRDSANYKKVRRRYQRVEARLANIRLNYIHHITREIVNLKPKIITMEDLRVSNMLKNSKLSPHIHKACWRMFRDIMTFKAMRYGIDVQIAPWWFPSSKNCCRCGHKKKKLGLDERVYRCKECGLEIDRDLNAAINLQWFNYNRI